MLKYLRRKGWRLLYPPRRGRRWASKRWGWTYCTVGKIITQGYLRETYFHNLIGAFVMEVSRFPFSEQRRGWQRPNPSAYQVTAIGLPMGGYGRREMNGAPDEVTAARWRKQYIKPRKRYCCRRIIAFVADWLARALWFIEIRGCPPMGSHPMHGTLTRRYQVGD